MRQNRQCKKEQRGAFGTFSKRPIDLFIVIAEVPLIYGCGKIHELFFVPFSSFIAKI